MRIIQAMVILEITILLLICVLISAVIDHFVPIIAPPLIQVAIGLAVSFLFQGWFDIQISDNLFMVLFIAPLLYYEASNASKTTLAKNRKAILSLAIGLVLVSTLFVGFTLNAIIPAIPLAAAFALGAALGPTDAVAVTSLPEDVKIGKRLEGTLKGECLINDASGVVCFEFAILALTTGSFSLTGATVSFFKLFVGGSLFGLVIGFIFVYILNKIREKGIGDNTFQVLFDLATPFVIYFLAEKIGVSGVLAVVAAGLVKSFRGNDIDPVFSKMSIVSTSAWEVLAYAINGIVFVMLGFQLPKVMASLLVDTSISNFKLMTYVVAITFALFLCRFVWVWVMEKGHDKSLNWFSKPVLHNTLLMTVGGPKGAVSMAIAMSIPLTVAGGEALPGRSILLFIAGGVIILSLVMSNFILPFIMPKRFKRQVKINKEEQEDLQAIQIEVLRGVIEELAARQTPQTKHATENVIQKYSKRIEDLKSNLDFNDELNTSIRLKAIEWEREFVEQQLKNGKVSVNVAIKYLRRLTRRQQILNNHTSLLWNIRNFFARTNMFLKNLPKKTKNIANNNLIEPGETAKFSTSEILSKAEPINDIQDLQFAALNHTINKINDEIANGGIEPTEDMTNVITEYRQMVNSLRSKSPSITAMSDLKDKENKITMLGLTIEANKIKDLYEKKVITFDQMRRLLVQVRMIQVAYEEF